MTPIEVRVAAAFQDLLELPSATPDSDFFELGGDSFLAVKLALILEDEFGIEFPVELIEQVATVAELAAWIDAAVSRR